MVRFHGRPESYRIISSCSRCPAWALSISHPSPVLIITALRAIELLSPLCACCICPPPHAVIFLITSSGSCGRAVFHVTATRRVAPCEPRSSPPGSAGSERSFSHPAATAFYRIGEEREEIAHRAGRSAAASSSGHVSRSPATRHEEVSKLTSVQRRLITHRGSSNVYL